MLWMSLLWSAQAETPEAPAAAAEAAAPAWSTLALTKLDGTPLDPATLQGKAVLVVNVASKCGFTKQYEGLEALHDTYAERGLVVVGVPCNQFGGQEPGSPEEIATFCRLTYGVEFPLLAKQDVNGAERSPLYRWLVGSDVGAGKDIDWNFEKFLVGRDGAVAGRWSSRVTPQDPELIAAIEGALTGGS